MHAYLQQSVDKSILVVGFTCVTLDAHDVASHVRQNQRAEMITSFSLSLIAGFILRHKLFAQNTESDLGVQIDVR